MLKQRKKVLLDPAVFGSPESPLFTHEDHTRIHKERMKLEMVVATLNQRLQSLRLEAQKVKENVVSQGELTVLKAETRTNLSTANSIRLNDLINLFTETMRDVSAASATCDTLEQMIDEEIRFREQFVNESATVANALCFDEYHLRLPHLLSQNVKPVNDTDIDASRCEQRITEIRGEIATIESSINFSSIESTAALEMARSTESQWNLKSAGTFSLRNEIQRLQKYLADGESQVRDLEQANESERARFDEFVNASTQDVTQMDERLRQASEEWGREVAQLDEQCRQLQMRVKMAAASYDRICAEIVELDSAEHGDLSDSGEDFEDEEEDVPVQTPQQLTDEKVSLEKEIHDLEKKYKHAKSAVKKKETSLKTSIRSLNARYHHLKEEQKLRAGSLLSQHSDSSYLQKEIASLIQKIDGSITELRSDLAA